MRGTTPHLCVWPGCPCSTTWTPTHSLRSWGREPFWRGAQLWGSPPGNKTLHPPLMNASLEGSLPTVLQSSRLSFLLVLWLTGSKYWAFNGEQMLQGYPRDIHFSLGFPQRVKKINAAVHEDDTRKTYFFVANEYWR